MAHLDGTARFLPRKQTTEFAYAPSRGYHCGEHSAQVARCIAMPQAQVAEGEVETLLKSPSKSVSGHHLWKPKPNKSWVQLDVPVVINDPAFKNVNLRITVNVSHVSGRSTFS